MPHACLTASCFAGRTHLLYQKLRLLHMADPVPVCFFRRFLRLKSQSGLTSLALHPRFGGTNNLLGINVECFLQF